MANTLGTGAAGKAEEAIKKRKKMNKEAADMVDGQGGSSGDSSGMTLKAPKMKDASQGAFGDYQMKQAIEMVKKRKTAQRSAY